MFKSLYQRVIVVTLIVMCLSGFLSFLCGNVYYHLNLKSSKDHKVTEISNEIKHNIEHYHQLANIDEYLNHIANLGYHVAWVELSSKESTIYGDGFESHEITDEMINTLNDNKVYHGIKKQSFHLFVTGLFNEDVSNSVGQRVMLNQKEYGLFIQLNQDKLFGEFRYFLAVLLLSMILFSIILVLLSNVAIVKPLKKLMNKVDQVGDGTFDISFDTKRRDEIGRLNEHFQQMQTKLKQTDTMKTEFVSNVSHELKSPLTIIDGLGEEMSQTSNEVDRKAIYNKLHREIDQLARLNEQLLLLSRLDSGDIEQNDRINIREQLSYIIRNFEYALSNKDLMIMMNVMDSDIKGNEVLFYQVWYNLIQNAINHSPIAGEIKIEAKQKKDFWLIIIDNELNLSNDNNPMDQSKLTERFYKSNKSTSGHGLGLAIVDDIVTKHGGELRIEVVDHHFRAIVQINRY